MNRKGQISMEYLLIVGVILVIAAGAVLTMTKFNPTDTASEGLDKSKQQLSEMNMAVGKIGVVGGGLNGAGIARDAALRGLRVLLLEKNDFGSGTSSWTSRL